MSAGVVGRRGLRAGLLAALAAGACASPPPRAEVPTSAPRAEHRPDPEPSAAELALGRLLAELSTMLRGRYEGRALSRYVASVGERVRRASDRPELGLRFVVTDDADVSAHALVGGQILVSRGTLAWLGSEAELAAVLAHEVAHAVKRHPRAERDDHAPEPVDLAASSRAFALDSDEERQADALGVEYLRRAGYDPRAMGSALAALHRGAAHAAGANAADAVAEDDPHPALAARLARVAVAAQGARGERGEARYAEQVHGLALGQSPTAPRVENDRYVAPGALSFALPAGRVGELTGALLSTTGLEPRLAIARFLGSTWREALYTALQREPHEWRSQPSGKVLVGRLRSEGTPSRAALLERAGSLFLVVVDGDDGRAESALEAVLQSTRTEPEVAAPARRLSVRRVERAGTLRHLCRPRSERELGEVATLNGSGLDELRPRGSFVKCVASRPEPAK